MQVVDPAGTPLPAVTVHVVDWKRIDPAAMRRAMQAARTRGPVPGESPMTVFAPLGERLVADAEGIVVVPPFNDWAMLLALGPDYRGNAEGRRRPHIGGKSHRDHRRTRP